MTPDQGDRVNLDEAAAENERRRIALTGSALGGNLANEGTMDGSDKAGVAQRESVGAGKPKRAGATPNAPEVVGSTPTSGFVSSVMSEARMAVRRAACEYVRNGPIPDFAMLDVALNEATAEIKDVLTGWSSPMTPEQRLEAVARHLGVPEEEWSWRK